MIAPPKPDLVTVNIDGKEIAVPKGTNVIEAARLVGVDVPHYCYHPKLSIVGNCRMCLVEMGLPAVDPSTKAPILDPTTGRQKINWIPRPQIGCGTNASPGLHIRTTSPLVKDCREGVMEFLLINHPLDCPICDQAGECKLQEQATGYGRGYSRYIEQKNVKPKRTQLGPRVTLDDERCILCSRCIRFCKEIVKDDVLGFIDRGSYSTLTCFPGRQLTNNYSLNTVDLCPVGALTSSDFRFKMRVWFLKQTNSIDTESSVGANTIVWSREGVIYRITPRRNNEVNDDWMPDSGRVLYKQVNARDRLRVPKVNGGDATYEAAVAAAAEILQVGRGVPTEPPAEAASPDKPAPTRSEPAAHRDGAPHPSAIALVCSGRSSVEEQFLAKQLAAALGATTHLANHIGLSDGILISADRTPNVRGALVVGLINKLPDDGAAVLRNAVVAERVSVSHSSEKLTLSATTAGEPPTLPTGSIAGGLGGLGAAIDAGTVRCVVSLGEDLLGAGLTPAQLAKVAVIYLGTHANATAAVARVLLPTLTVFEKHGTFINQQFRIQKFHRAIPGPVGVQDDLQTLAQLFAAGSPGRVAPADVHALWKLIAAEVPALGTMSFANIPDTGLLLDATPWANLPFVEGETLHYHGPSRAANPQAGKPSTPDNS